MEPDDRLRPGTALHELGHVPGMEHEHQNPYAGIKWHEEAVYQALGKPPNSWSRETTFRNILQKLSPEQVQGSTWDPDSIMEYEFEPGLIDEPDQYDTNGLVPPATLSSTDKSWALQWYPGSAPQPAGLEPFKSIAVDLAAGQQVDFVFQPPASRAYTIATTGASDTLLGLFEQIGDEPRYLAADDDSGEDRNASISYKLFAGRTYHVRLRLYYPGQTGTTSLMVSSEDSRTAQGVRSLAGRCRMRSRWPVSARPVSASLQPRRSKKTRPRPR